jgi:hypothetical protein
MHTSPSSTRTWTTLFLSCILLSYSCDETRLAMEVSADDSKQKLKTYSDYSVDKLTGLNFGLQLISWAGGGGRGGAEGYGFFPSGVSSGTVSHTKGFGYDVGLDFIQKGYSISDGGGNVHLNYLEAPIHGLYQYPVGPGAIRAGLGPYFAYGIGGKADGQNSFGNGANDVGYKRFDAGLSVSAGYELDMGLSLTLGYDYGLTNAAYTTGDFISANNRTLSLKVGFEFGHLLKH